MNGNILNYIHHLMWFGIFPLYFPPIRQTHFARRFVKNLSFCRLVTSPLYRCNQRCPYAHWKQLF